MKLEAVLVWWADAETDSGWLESGELKDPELIPAVGIIVRDTPEYLTLALTVDHTTSDVTPILAIPKGTIKSQTVIWTWRK